MLIVVLKDLWIPVEILLNEELTDKEKLKVLQRLQNARKCGIIYIMAITILKPL